MKYLSMVCFGVLSYATVVSASLLPIEYLADNRMFSSWGSGTGSYTAVPATPYADWRGSEVKNTHM